MRIFHHKDRLHGQRIQPRVIHARRHRTGRRIEILHLIRPHMLFMQILGQHNRVLQRTARVGRHEVGHEILLTAGTFIDFFVCADKFLIDLILRLAHEREYIRRHVLGCHAELPGDMMLADLAHKSLIRVEHHVVEADAGSDKHFFHFWQLPNRPKYIEIFPVVSNQVGAGFRVETLSVFAGTDFQLLFAGRRSEIGSRTADVVDVAFEFGVVSHLHGLLDDRSLASRLHDPPLMKSEGAEITAAVASAVGRNTELDFLDGGDAACIFIHRMVGPHVGQRVNVVHLQHRKRLRGRILDNIQGTVVDLIEDFGLERVRILILDPKALRVRAPVTFYLLIIRQAYRVVDPFRVAGLIDSPRDEGDVTDTKTRGERVRDLDDAVLSHTVGNKVCSGIEQNRPADRIRPVIVVGKATKRCLQASEDDRCLLVYLSDEVAVHDDRAIRPLSHDSAGCERVRLPALFGHRVMVHHGIHVAG